MRDNTLYNILAIFTAVVLTASICIMGWNLFYDYYSESEAIESVYAGEIVDKKIENARQGLFTSSDTEYRIYIEFEYTHDDETQTGEKYFTVDKETYLAYDIGDWFDSHDFEYVEVEEG